MAELNMHRITILRLTPSNMEVANCTTIVFTLVNGLRDDDDDDDEYE